MRGIANWAAIVIPAWLCAAILPSAAQESGAAQGALMLGQENIPLTHVYAREVQQLPELALEGRPLHQISVIVTDRPIPDNMPKTSFAMSQMASAGQIRGLSIDLDAETGAILGGNVYLGAEYFPQFFSQTGGSDYFRVEGFSFAGGELKARLRAAEPQDLLGSESAASTYGFDATVTAAVAPAPKLLQTLQGDAARNSEPRAAFKKFLDALAAGDVAGAKAGIVANHPGQEMMTAEGLPQVKIMLLAGYADADAFLADLKKVFLYETRAILFFSAADGSSSTSMTMAREGGAWKLGGE
jgi:hypothetical protein